MTIEKKILAFYLPTTRQIVFSAPTQFLWHLSEKRNCEIALFAPSSTVITPVETPGTTSFHRRRCNTYSHVTLGNTIRGSCINWNVKGSYTCISSNVIYAIIYTRCEKNYIRETERRLADRFLNTFVQSRTIFLDYRLRRISIHRNIPFLTLKYPL